MLAHPVLRPLLHWLVHMGEVAKRLQGLRTVKEWEGEIFGAPGPLSVVSKLDICLTFPFSAHRTDVKSLSCISSVPEGCEAEPSLLWHCGMSGGSGCPGSQRWVMLCLAYLRLEMSTWESPTGPCGSHVIQSIGQCSAGRKCDFFPSFPLSRKFSKR